VHPAVAGLGLEEKGFVLGALLARATPATVAEQLGAPAGPRCAAAIEALGGETRAARASEIAGLIALVRAPVPGVERIHPDWLRARLEREPSDVVRAVTAGLPDAVGRVAAAILARRDDGRARNAFSPAGVAELRQVVFAGLVPMAGAGVPSTARVRALLEVAPAALEAAIEARGAEALGASLRGAPGPVVARAAAAVGDRLAGFVLEAAARDGTAEARAHARQLVAAAGARQPGETAAWIIGCGAIAADLAGDGPAAIAALAQRLPMARARRLLAAAGLGEPFGVEV
jgi:hypothetical protein